jgi:hypothetical protein
VPPEQRRIFPRVNGATVRPVLQLAQTAGAGDARSDLQKFTLPENTEFHAGSKLIVC